MGTFRFGDFEFDSGALELRRAGRVVPIEPTPLRVLLYLIQERRRVVHKDDLRRAVWRDVIVGDAALAGALRDVRRALGDDGAQQRWIRTRQRVGYQFVGKVDVAEAERGAPDVPMRRLRLHGAVRGVSRAFTGRSAELAQLEALLTRDTYWSPQVSIEGLAGIGKTELALQLVHKLVHRGAFPGGIFWLDASQPDLRGLWGGLIADQLGLPFATAEARSARVVDELERSGEPLLLVLDNIESWSALARPGPLPLAPHVRVLVTTRQRNFGGARFAHVSLAPLAAPHDRELLEQLALRPLGAEAEGLLERLGGHALGLELAGAFLGTYAGESASGYLAALVRDEEASESLVKDRVGYEGTVAQAFRTVCPRLSGPAREAWWLASFFDPEPVTREIAHACGIERESLRVLEESHLVQSAADGTWTMHPLARAFGARLTPEPARALALLEPMSRRLGVRQSAPTELRRVYEAADRLRHTGGPGAERILDALAEHWHSRFMGTDARGAVNLASAIEQLAHVSGSDVNLLAACCAHSGIAMCAGRLEESLAWSQRGLELCDALDRAGSPATADRRLFLLANLGLVRLYLGFPDSGLPAIQTAEQLAARASPETLAYVVISAQVFRYLRGEWTEVLEYGAQLVECMTQTPMPSIEIFAALLDAGARLFGSASPVEAVLEQVQATWRLHPETELNEREILAAGLYIRLGRQREARDALREGLRLLDKSGERYFEVELWRHWAACETDPAERRAALERALLVAASQSNRWFGLRAATDLLASAETPAERASARERLEELYDSFTEGFELPDLRRARALLERPDDGAG